MKKSLVWGRYGLVLMAAAMAFAATAAPPPTDKVHEVTGKYLSSSNVIDKSAVGQVASTGVGAVVQPGNDIKVASCSPPNVVTSKNTVLNCGWGKVKQMAVVGVTKMGANSPPLGFDATRAASNSSPTYSLKKIDVGAVSLGLCVGSPGLTGLDLLNTKPSGTAAVSAAASIASAKIDLDLDPVFGGIIAANVGDVTT